MKSSTKAIANDECVRRHLCNVTNIQHVVELTNIMGYQLNWQISHKGCFKGYFSRATAQQTLKSEKQYQNKRKQDTNREM